MADLFGRLPDGRAVERFRLTNAGGVEVDLVPYGAAVVSLRVPDRTGRLSDVVLGFADLEGYLACEHFVGGVVGRYANRIARGRFELDGRTYVLATNDGAHHLHGGRRGFDKVLWQPAPFEGAAGQGVAFAYASHDGEEGYPGNVDVRVSYALTDANELVFECRATCDAATPFGLAQHCYWNLAGEGDVLGHALTIHAAAYTPTDAGLIPTGDIATVAGTPFDFRAPRAIGERIDAPHPQLGYGRGYDHNFVIEGSREGLVPAARVVEPVSGRTLDVVTTEPGLHFYSGNHLKGGRPGKRGQPYGPREGLCLETQPFPDSPNQPSFPSAILRPGRTHRSKTVFAFGVV